MKLTKILGVIAISSAVIFTSIACGQGTEAKPIPPVTQEQKAVPLKFKSVTVENTITSITTNKIHEIIKQYNVGDDKYIIFMEKGDTENLHSGVIINNKIYGFGKVSMMGEKNSTDLYDVKELELYGKKVAKITGTLGANYAPTNYYYVENQPPQILLHSEGHTKEIDLDNDGIEEIISSTPLGVASSTDIYKYDNGSFTFANLNEALNAITVYPTDMDWKVFEAYFKDLPNQPKNYEYTQEGLEEIKR